MPRANQISVGPNDNWAAAISGAGPDTEVLLEDGVYNLASGTIFIESSALTIRGASGDRGAVVIQGPGYGVAGEGFMLGGSDITIADLTMSDIRDHAISIKPELGASQIALYNLHLVDIGTQHIKASAAADNVDGIVACSSIGYTDGGALGDYNGAIDIHRAVDWIIRDNHIYNITGDGSSCNASDPNDCGYTTAPAIYLWNNSRGGLIERNMLVNNARNIALGLDRVHVGAVVRNNFIYNPGDALGGIELSTASDILVEHNTVIIGGSHPGAIEFRAASTIEVRNNLLSKDLWFKGGNDAITSNGNIVDATTADFVSPGWPHIDARSRAVGAGVTSQLGFDLDGDRRDGNWDVGADQLHYVIAGPEPEPEPITPPAGRLTPSDLSYVGAFMAPAGAPNRGFAYGGRAAAFNPLGDPDSDDGFDGSLFLSGHTTNEMVGELTIPTPAQHQGTTVGLPVADVLQQPADITDGRGAQYVGSSERGGLDDFRVGGLEVVLDGPGGPRLHWAIWQYYNNGYSDVAGHGHSTLNLSDPDPQGPWYLANFKSNETAGYLFSVPEPFADQYLSGRRLIAGWQDHESSANSSWGPPFFAFDPPATAPPESRIAADALTNYPYPDHFLTPETVTSLTPGAAWVAAPDGRAAIVTVGNRAGTVRYGLPEPGDCSQYHGYHGDPYEPQVMFYDPADLAAVTSGELQPFQVRPYLTWNPAEHLVPTCDWLLSSISHDEQSNRIYVVQVGADTSQSVYEPLPVIHVFEVG